MSDSKATYDALKKIRKDWGDISPVTKIIPNKKKKKKEKYPKQKMEDKINEME